MKIEFSNHFLLHPGVIFFGIVLGIVIGLTSTRLPPHLAPLGRIYIALLQMCILPIVITAITSSLGHLLHTQSFSGYLQRLVCVFVIGMLLAAVMGFLVGVITK